MTPDMTARRLFFLSDSLLYKVYLESQTGKVVCINEDIEEILRTVLLERKNVTSFRTDSYHVQVSKKPWKNAKSIEYSYHDKAVETYSDEIWLSLKPLDNVNYQNQAKKKLEEGSSANKRSRSYLGGGNATGMYKGRQEALKRNGRTEHVLHETSGTDGKEQSVDSNVNDNDLVNGQGAIQSVKVLDDGRFPMGRVNADLRELKTLQSLLQKRESKTKFLGAESTCKSRKKQGVKCRKEINMNTEDEGSVHSPAKKHPRSKLESDSGNASDRSGWDEDMTGVFRGVTSYKAEGNSSNEECTVGKLGGCRDSVIVISESSDSDTNEEEKHSEKLTPEIVGKSAATEEKECCPTVPHSSQPIFKIPSLTYQRKRLRKDVGTSLCSSTVCSVSRSVPQTSQPKQKVMSTDLFYSSNGSSHQKRKLSWDAMKTIQSQSEIGQEKSHTQDIENGVNGLAAHKNRNPVCELNAGNVRTSAGDDTSASVVSRRSFTSASQQRASTPKRLDASKLSHLEELLLTRPIQRSPRLALLTSQRSKSKTSSISSRCKHTHLRDEVVKSNYEMKRQREEISRPKFVGGLRMDNLSEGQVFGNGGYVQNEQHIADAPGSDISDQPEDKVRLSPSDRCLPKRLAKVLTPTEYQVVFSNDRDALDIGTPYEGQRGLESFHEKKDIAQVENKGALAILTPVNQSAPKIIASAKAFDKVQRKIHWRDCDSFIRSTNKEPSCYTRDRMLIHEEETNEAMKLALYARPSDHSEGNTLAETTQRPSHRPTNFFSKALQLFSNFW